MSQDIPKPVIVIAVIVAVLLAVFIGKSLMGSSPTASKAERDKFVPSWIDPATNKPRAGAAPQTGGPGGGGPPPGMTPGGASSRPMGSSGGH